MSEENKYDTKLPRFDGSRTDDFHLWFLPVKTALKSGQVASALRDENVEENINERALSIFLMHWVTNLCEPYKIVKQQGLYGRKLN